MAPRLGAATSSNRRVLALGTLLAASAAQAADRLRIGAGQQAHLAWIPEIVTVLDEGAVAATADVHVTLSAVGADQMMVDGDIVDAPAGQFGPELVRAYDELRRRERI